jgi:hypothetical protein
LISGSGLGLLVELVSVGEVGCAGLQGLALISGSGLGLGSKLGLLVELVSVGEVGRAGLQGMRLDLGIGVEAGGELVSEVIPSGEAGRAGVQGRGLQGQAGGLGAELVAVDAIGTGAGAG